MSDETLNRWDGKGGIPPVGTVCETKLASEFQWVPVTVRWVGKTVFVVELLTNGEERAYHRSHRSYRIYRTAEELAAAEREAAVAQIMKDAGITGSAFADDPEARVWAEALHDNSYRKMDKKDCHR